MLEKLPSCCQLGILYLWCPSTTFYLVLWYLDTCLCPTQPVNTWTALCSSFKEYLIHTQALHLLSHLTLTIELGTFYLLETDMEIQSREVIF